MRHTKKSVLKDFTRYNYFIHNLFDVIPMVNKVKTNYLQHDPFISFSAYFIFTLESVLNLQTFSKKDTKMVSLMVNFG